MAKADRITHPCVDCEVARCNRLLPTGRKSAKFLIITPPPRSDTQVNKGIYMMDAAAKLLSQQLQAQGFSRSDFVFQPAIQCAYDESKWKAKERNVIMKQCREYFLRTVDKLAPEVIIPLGALAARIVSNRVTKITKVAGVPQYNEQFDAYVLPMLDPLQVHLYPQHLPTFSTGCKTLRDLVDSDYNLTTLQEQKTGDYQIVDDLQFLIDDPPDELGFDVETVGLRAMDPAGRLLTMQFTPREGEGYMVVWDHPERPASIRQKRKLKEQIQRILQHPNTDIVGQNLKFDALWVLTRLGFRFRIAHDTLMLATIIDENLQNKDLDTLVKIFVPEMAGYADWFNNQYDKERMDLVPLDDLLTYGCGDTDASLRLYHELRPRVEEDWRLWAHYQRASIPGINAFVNIERRGLLISEEALDEFEDTLSESVQERKMQLLARIDQGIKRKHMRAGDRKGVSFNRREFLRDVLFNHPRGCRLTPRVFTKGTAKLEESERIPSTSTKDHLPYFTEHPQHGRFVTDLSEWLKDDRMLGTNVRGFREKYMIGNHVHPSYSLWTAVTGRTASRDPNGQNFPKRGKNAKAYRSIFVAPPGYVLLEADLSQAELRIAADMSCDEEMLRIYNTLGGDIHTETACVVMGLTMQEFKRLPKDEQKMGRFKAKAVNFGFLYGMWWRKFVVYAKTQYGVEFTDREAEAIRERFFEKYGRLSGWHAAMRQQVREHKFVRSYSGRIRHLPMIDSPEDFIAQEAERQAINSPVQEFASTLGVMAIGRLDLEVDDRYLAIVGFVHDAIYAMVPEQYAEWGAKTLKWYMETNPIEEWFDRRLQVPIVADVSFGLDGGHMFEMEGLDLDEDFDFDSVEDLDFELPEQEWPENNGLQEIPDYMLPLAA